MVSSWSLNIVFIRMSRFSSGGLSDGRVGRCRGSYLFQVGLMSMEVGGGMCTGYGRISFCGWLKYIGSGMVKRHLLLFSMRDRLWLDTNVWVILVVLEGNVDA